MENNKMQLMVECEECKEKFAVNSGQGPNSLENKKKYEIEGQSIFLTYYDCPSCGRRHFVQIDDEASLRILREVTSQFTKLAAKRKQGNEIPKRHTEKFNKSRKHLSNYRLGLMKKYTGKVIFDEVGSKYVLRFSI